jgi:hypothetical protein
MEIYTNSNFELGMLTDKEDTYVVSTMSITHIQKKKNFGEFIKRKKSFKGYRGREV